MATNIHCACHTLSNSLCLASFNFGPCPKFSSIEKETFTEYLRPSDTAFIKNREN